MDTVGVSIELKDVVFCDGLWTVSKTIKGQELNVYGDDRFVVLEKATEQFNRYLSYINGLVNSAEASNLRLQG